MEKYEIDDATAYVNKSSGFLTLNCQFASINNPDLPLKTSLVYNSLYNEIFTEIDVPKIFGNNFKLNFQQYVRQSGDILYLYDADGSVTIFYKDSGYDVYRSTDGMLTAKITGIETTVFDTQLNTRVFNNGRLCEIYKGEEIVNNPNYRDRIIISYQQSGGIDTDKISQIAFYNSNESILSYKITFSYTSNRVTNVRTYQKTNLLTSYSLSYNSDGNLICIRNISASTDLLTMEYGTDNNIEAVFNKKHDGMYFSYPIYSDKIWKINQIKGANVDNSRWSDYIEFNYDSFSVTETKYYVNGYCTSKNFVCFNASRNPVSEWGENEKGEISGINRGYWNSIYEENEYLFDYTKEDLSFIEKQNTSFPSYSNISTGETASGSVSSSSGIVNNAIYKYGLSFKIESRLDIDLTVSFAGKTKRIILKNGGTLYVILPCGYVRSGTFTFKNNNSIRITRISNVSYTVIDYLKTTKVFKGEKYNAYGISEAISYNTAGEYEKLSYDEYQRLSKKETESISDTTLETNSYTYITPDADIYYDLSKEETKRNGIITSTVKYSYGSNGKGVPIYIFTTKNDTKMRTIYTQTGYSSTGGYTVTQTDENGVATDSVYANLSGDIRLQSIQTGNIKEKYEYNYLGEITRVQRIQTDSGTVILDSQNTYTNGLCSGYSFAQNYFSNVYDANGLTTDINQNGNVKIHYDYNPESYYDFYNDLQRKTYANGQTEEYSYSSDKTIVTDKSQANDSTPEVYTFNYDNKDRIQSSSYSVNGTEYLNYNYGNLNSTTQNSLAITGELEYNMLYTVNYDAVYKRINSNVSQFTKNDQTSTYTATSMYNSKNQISSNSLNSYNSTVSYDDYDKIDAYISKYNSTSVVNQSYVYDVYSRQNFSANRLKAIIDNIHTDLSYRSMNEYDNKGYITSVQYGNKVYNYTYDGAGRLTGESYNGINTTYTYNSYNTILSINKNDVITGYNYDSCGRITSFVDNSVPNFFRYDSMGNPTMYKGASATGADNMVWTQGRKLESGSLNGNAFAYKYDMNGIRYNKIVNGNETEYYLDGNRITAENRKSADGDKFIYYIYDMSGLSGMIYDGAYYYYERNTLGDIIRIRNSNGAEVAAYSYDAWGNILTKTGSMADINSFRYRGYYCDTETGFYYLQSRYYDPSIHMFINSDDYEMLDTLASTVGQLNLYAYCNNNPIMYTDESGTVITEAFLIGCIITCTLASTASQLIYNKITNTEWYSGLAGAFFGGAINGLLLGLGCPVFLSGIGAGIINAGVNQAEYAITKNNRLGWDTFFAETCIYSVMYGGSNYMGSTIYPINSGWFLPKTLSGFFTGEIGQRVMIQAGIYGTIGSLWANILIDTANPTIVKNRNSVNIYNLYIIGE